MSDWRDDAIEAARDAWHGAIVDIPEAVVDAVAPIIRADERARLHRDGWATPEQLEAMIAAAKARVLIHERERIAQEIEKMVKADE